MVGFEDLRSFMDALEKEGELKKVEKEVDPKYEIAAVLDELDKKGGPAVLFKNVKGYKTSVVGNICGTRKRIGKALGVEYDKVTFKYMEALEKPVPYRVVGSGPVKENVFNSGFDVLELLPVLTHSEGDVGPYVTMGVLIYRDPETKAKGASIQRIQVKGNNRLVVFPATRPLIDYVGNAEKMDVPMEVAITVGYEPAFLLAACAEVPVGFDKLTLVGSLKGKELNVVKCETLDLEVPTNCEFVLEGELLPKVREDEGPVGEAWGYYTTSKSPVINIKTITCRENPIYQATTFTSMETYNLIAIPLEAALFKAIQRHVPTVKNVHIDSTWFHAFISIEKKREGDSRTALLIALESPFIKHAVVVDEDVDIYSLRDVWWAIDTRFQGDKDLLVVSGMPSMNIDPSCGELTAKVGVDATKTLAEQEKFRRIKVARKVKLEEYLS
ncbi:UbiD family decarboxylase [Candidatus Bathyarchaeota archaeon]|nr:MAG: UbiD family decarboxylase [Candidatus Bathyarchaeota archaeon]